MERWSQKVAVVTGASSGIGAAITKELAKANVIVIGLARNVQKIEELNNDIPENFRKNLNGMQCDVSDEGQVIKIFETICKNFGGIDILINNAGIFRSGNLSTMNTDLIREQIDTNVMGVVMPTRQAFKSMMDRQVYGHIIIMNSIAGHKIVAPISDGPSINIYPSTKFALTAMTEIYRQEFKKLNPKVKVTSISPALTRTNILPKEWANLDTTYLQPEDIANAVMYVLGTPQHVEVAELTVLPLEIK